MIKIEGLTKKYDDIIAVNHLDLTINKGELFALLGVNGAGKTTLIKMLSTLLKPTSGNAYINGYSIVDEQNKIEVKKGIGGIEYKRRKERQSEFRKLNTKLKKCEELIETLETNSENLKELLADDKVNSDYSELSRITIELDEIEKKLEESYNEWESIQEELSAYSDIVTTE